MRRAACIMVLPVFALSCAPPPAPPVQWTEPVTRMVFALIPAGTFIMGSPATEAGREPQEQPHEVTIGRPFYLGVYEVTQRQYEVVMGANPSTFAGDADRPVEQVSWFDVRAFIDRLNAQSSGGLRLPTEAEWEYACRAGTTAAYATGDVLSSQQANVAEQPMREADSRASGRATARVGTFPPNAWGLHDMHGNVWEWTSDEACPYQEGAIADPRMACGSDLKRIRGGSWYFGADSARCALRYTHPPDERGFSLGFRVARDLPR